jgi:hypothetical protein
MDVTPLPGQVLPIHFILGIGRSGTTLLSGMLHCHPEIISTPENNFLLFSQNVVGDLHQIMNSKTKEQYRDLANRKHNHETSIWGWNKDELSSLLDQKDEISFSRLSTEMYLSYAPEKRPTARMIIDKNPIYTTQAERIAELYPESLFICLSRHYLNNAASRLRTRQKKEEDVVETGLSWVIYNEFMLNLMRLYPDRCIHVRYEDLTGDTENTIRRICNLLKIPFYPGMLEPEKKSEIIFKKASENLQTEELEKVSAMHAHLKEKVNPEIGNKSLEILTPEDKSVLKGICEPTASKLGYKEVQDSVRGEIRLLRFKLLRFKIKLRLFTYIYYQAPFAIRKLFISRRE